MRALALGGSPSRLDPSQAEAFIAALTGSKDTPILLQFADDTPRKLKDLERVHAGTLRQLVDVIEKLNAARAAVWMQVNAGRRGKKNVTQARACFIDDDGKSKLAPLPRLPPSITVASSDNPRNRHYYWLLQPGQSLERWPQVQRHLAVFYGADKSMVNLDRVMRLPGTWNQHGPCHDEKCAKCNNFRRRERPEAVRLLTVDTNHRYTYDQLIAAHPLPEEAQADALAVAAPREAPTDAALAMAKRIGYWLTTREVEHERVDAVTFRLKRCVFNPEHREKLMIRIQSRGGIWAGCWHDSCGGNSNRWSSVKDRIGEWAQDAAPFSRGDDVELAQRLIADLTGSSEEPLVSDLGSTWKYQPASGLWTSIDDSVLSATLAGYAGMKCGKRPLKIDRPKVRGAMAMTHDLTAQPGFFGEAPPGVAFTNGVLMATPNGAAFVPHDAENRLILGLPFDYVEGAKCDRWRTYLSECFRDDEDAAEKIDLLQEFLGACLIGIAPRYQKALLLYGSGDNGKSVYTWVASALFPAAVRRSIKPQDWGREYYLAQLATARVNIVGEMPETDILSGDAFKAVISGDNVEARQPTERTFQVAMKAGHIFSCNRLPGTADHTYGFWKRFIIVEWLRVFPVGHPMRDNSLREKIVAAEMPGVAAWAVAGASRLLARDALTVPASHARLLKAWQTDADAVAAFLAECCEPVLEGTGLSNRELYPVFKLWANAAGRRPIADSTFGRRLKENKIHSFIHDGYTRYMVRLLPDALTRYAAWGLLP